MRNKVAKMLRRVAVVRAVGKTAKDAVAIRGALKKAWNRTPRKLRHGARVDLTKEIPVKKHAKE